MGINEEDQIKNIKNFMTKSGQTIFKPALAKDIFSKDDFIK